MVASGRVAELVRDATRASDLPDGVAITFRLEGDGGGVWTLVREEGRVELRFGELETADCWFSSTVEDFSAWIRGELDPIRAHLEQRVRLEGDVGLILRIRRGGSMASHPLGSRNR